MRFVLGSRRLRAGRGSARSRTGRATLRKRRTSVARGSHEGRATRRRDAGRGLGVVAQGPRNGCARVGRGSREVRGECIARVSSGCARSSARRDRPSAARARPGSREGRGGCRRSWVLKPFTAHTHAQPTSTVHPTPRTAPRSPREPRERRLRPESEVFVGKLVRPCIALPLSSLSAPRLARTWARERAEQAVVGGSVGRLHNN